MKKIGPYATARLEAIRIIPKASQFIPHVDQLKPGLAVIYARASSRRQKANLFHQIERLKSELEKRGFTVIAVYREIVPGWYCMYWERCRRLKLELAIMKAKETGAVVVAVSVDRFRRHWKRDWSPGQPQPPLSLFDFHGLMDEAQGVQLATLVHPDTPPEEVRAEQTKRGQAAKRIEREKPGFMKERRLEFLPIVLELRQQGLSYRQIAQQVNISWSTVRDWIKGKSAHLSKSG